MDSRNATNHEQVKYKKTLCTYSKIKHRKKILEVTSQKAGRDVRMEVSVLRPLHAQDVVEVKNMCHDLRCNQ